MIEMGGLADIRIVPSCYCPFGLCSRAPPVSSGFCWLRIDHYDSRSHLHSKRAVKKDSIQHEVLRTMPRRPETYLKQVPLWAALQIIRPSLDRNQ